MLLFRGQDTYNAQRAKLKTPQVPGKRLSNVTEWLSWVTGVAFAGTLQGSSPYLNTPMET